MIADRERQPVGPNRLVHRFAPLVRYSCRTLAAGGGYLVGLSGGARVAAGDDRVPQLADRALPGACEGGLVVDGGGP